MAIPVHIVSGFLGTGKTSAIRAQLEARRGERIAVIVNDFGEASLDEATLSEARPFRLSNIAGACVCCTAPEGFVAALGAVLEAGPERLLIEPTGLARPQDLVDSIRRSPHAARLALGPVVVLVDPARLARAASDERRAIDAQVEAADVLVANRTDLCSADELEHFDAWARALWPAPLSVEHTRHGRVPTRLWEWPAGEGARLPRAAQADRAEHAHSTAGYAARSWRWSRDVVFARERLLAALERVARAEADAARFKGIFRTREGVLRLELAGARVHEAPSAHRRDSRADAIFRGEGAAGLARLEGWLEDARLGPAELEARAGALELVEADGRVRVLDRDALAALPGGVEDVGALFPKRAGRAARVRSLWRALSLAEQGRAVVMAADGFASEPVPVQALCEGFLVHSLGDAPLPREQGGPIRLLIPQGTPEAPPGCANVKAATRIVIRET
jgi:G3E family GTPase